MADEKDPPTQLGSFYPNKSVVAVLPDGDAARRAQADLGNAGFATDSIQVFSGAEVSNRETEIEENRSLFQKIGAFISDEDQWAQEYAEYGEQGQWFVVVDAPENTDAERARKALLPLGAHHMRYYSDATVTDLVPDAPVAGRDDNR
jgi:hypothetical protein